MFYKLTNYNDNSYYRINQFLFFFPFFFPLPFLKSLKSVAFLPPKNRNPKTKAAITIAAIISFDLLPYGSCVLVSVFVTFSTFSAGFYAGF
jgi:hypothetical protein